MIDDNQGFSINTLSGLELAKHVLVRLVNDQESIENYLKNTITPNTERGKGFQVIAGSGIKQFLKKINLI
jgi:hypothetical protein